MAASQTKKAACGQNDRRSDTVYPPSETEAKRCRMEYKACGLGGIKSKDFDALSSSARFTSKESLSFARDGPGGVVHRDRVRSEPRNSLLGIYANAISVAIQFQLHPQA